MSMTPHDDALLDRLQRESFAYFRTFVNPANGLVADKSRDGWPASIAATGLALAAYPVAVERGFMTRAEAVAITLTTLRFFQDSVQSTAPDATGYKGFYYHFLDMTTGRRAWQCELSTVDSGFLLAGALTAAAYFDGDGHDEQQIRTVADALYRRADWRWAQHGGATLTHGYKPRLGFLPYRWQGYDEALLLYVLALGSPTYPLPDESYPAWLSSYVWTSIYGYEFVYAGPLFIHQLSHVWIDFRGIQDSYMRDRGIDYFENSRRATFVQREYAIRNPLGFAVYGENCWGLTASDGPGPITVKVDGVERRFFDYLARGAPHGPDDGTIAPWAVVASLPFAPEIVMPAVRYLVDSVHLDEPREYGFKATFNPTFPVHPQNPYGWVSPWNFGLNQGPIVLMIENQRTDLVWRLMRGCPYIVQGLRRAGFRGGWL
jgi:hypothetical protein